MSALQMTTWACRISKPIHSFHASASASPPSFITQPLLFPYTHQNQSHNHKPTTSISTPTLIPKKRLLCRPPFGKHVREDYLVKKLCASEVQELVKGERNVPIVIDFYATWCGPCTLMAQQLEMLAVEYESNALIIKVDTDDEYEFARDMQVRGLPTLYFVSPDPNKDAIRTEGLIPIQMMRNILDNDM